ncbi:MAG: M23 family metallopeptidase [Clostridia bacterium]|nr:M23 family metallopeptidase [Clostridia bacterium]MDE7329139.1 M23 family metallopeptidase [Clostridia bacterium]
MAKKTQQTKDKRNGAPSQAGVRVAQFFKKNIYVILMIVCILAIATMITVAVVVNNSNEGEEVLKPIGSGDSNDDTNKPVVTPPPNDDTPVVTPPPSDDTPVTKEFILIAPLDVYTLGETFFDSELVFNPTHHFWATHEGVDFMAAAGSDVKCMFDGEVKSVESDGYHGTVVVIAHQDGYETVYKYLQSVDLQVGAKVAQGDVIGKVSETALEEVASGPHMHLELYKNGARVNPLDFMLQGDK